MLPGLDGLPSCGKCGEYGNQSPVLLLTAKDSIEDRVRGLDSGADDYLIKPFSLDELLARVRVLLRRQDSERKNVLSVADLVMDISTHEVTRAGRKIDLTSKEFAILEYLIRNKKQIADKNPDREPRLEL